MKAVAWTAAAATRGRLYQLTLGQRLHRRPVPSSAKATSNAARILPNRHGGLLVSARVLSASCEVVPRDRIGDHPLPGEMLAMGDERVWGDVDVAYASPVLGLVHRD